MSRIISFICITCFTLISVKAQDLSHQLYTSSGKKTNLDGVIKKAMEVDVVLFGEFHNDPIGHWMQYNLTKRMIDKLASRLVLGAEMFEADNQNILNDYLSGKIDDKAMDTLARLWPNYKTDYKPLVDLAKNAGIPFIACNIPRKFARQVFRFGLESLDTLNSEDKANIAPLPIQYDPNLPGYKAMLEMMGGHTSENLPKAQAIKDATMAHFIHTNRKEGQVFIHYNGSYHSNNYEGINWYLKKMNPNVKILTIATVEQQDIKTLNKEYYGLADFILCVDETMTKTH
jgi:uncharacterized iron-regulated protein